MMKNRKRLIILLLILIGIVSNICIIKKFRFRKNSTEFKLSYILTSDKQDLFQVFTVQIIMNLVKINLYQKNIKKFIDQKKWSF